MMASGVILAVVAAVAALAAIAADLLAPRVTGRWRDRAARARQSIASADVLQDPGRERRAEHRARELGINWVLQGTLDKIQPFRKLITTLDLDPRQVCYVGDDLLDLPVLRAAGLAACPADALPTGAEAGEWSDLKELAVTLGWSLPA